MAVVLPTPRNPVMILVGTALVIFMLELFDLTLFTQVLGDRVGKY